MKKLILAGAILLTTAFTAGAQGTDYKAVLTATFTAFDTTWSNQQAKLEAGNKLSLIAKKYPAEWAPQYYAAYSKVQLAYNDKIDAAKRDAYLDEADGYRDEVLHILGKENDETYVLAALIANGRLSVDGRARWQKYGKIFDEALDNAKTINENNPRIYVLRGMSKYFTPRMFGGGAKAAMPYFEKAQGLLAKESKDDITKPYWGTQINEYFIKKANGDKE